MKRPVIVWIECEDTQCKECRFSRNARAYTRQCFLQHKKIPNANCRADAERLPECHASERLLKDLITAGELQKDYILCGDGTMGDVTEEWDKAIDAVLQPNKKV